MSKEHESLVSGEAVFAVDKSVVPDTSTIEPADWSVLALVDGSRSVDSIVASLAMRADDVAASLSKFLQLRMIKPSGGGPAAAAQPQRSPSTGAPAQRRANHTARPPSPPPNAEESAGAGSTRGGPSGATGRARSSSTTSAAPDSPRADDAAAAQQKPDKKTKKKGIPFPESWPLPYDQFMFDPIMLDEDVELDLERRKAIIYYHYHLKRVTYYDLLDIPKSIRARDIKKAYFRLSKVFHPDKFFRKDVGSYRPMIEDVFKWISRAYATLNDAKKRAHYDSLLQSGLLGEWELESRKPVKAKHATLQKPVRAGSAALSARTNSRRTPSGQVARRNTPGSGRFRAKSSSSTQRASSRTIVAVTERNLQHKGGLLAKAEQAEANGDWEKAATHYIASLAVRFQPKAAHAAARCLLATGRRLDEAESLCRKVLSVEKGTKLRASALLTLGRVLEKQGRIAEAKAAYVEAQQNDPSDPMIAMCLNQISSRG